MRFTTGECGKGTALPSLPRTAGSGPSPTSPSSPLGAVDVPIYPTLTGDQIAELLNDSDTRVAFVSTRKQFDKLDRSAREDAPRAHRPHGFGRTACRRHPVFRAHRPRRRTWQPARSRSSTPSSAPSSRPTSPPSSTPPAPPASPRASCSPTATSPPIRTPAPVSFPSAAKTPASRSCRSPTSPRAPWTTSCTAAAHRSFTARSLTACPTP